MGHPQPLRAKDARGIWDEGGGRGPAHQFPVGVADGERLAEVTDPGRRPASAQASARRGKAEDSSESHEEEQVVTGAVTCLRWGGTGRDPWPESGGSTPGQVEQGAPSLE